MNTVDIYELFNDSQNNFIRLKKMKLLLKQVIYNGDKNSEEKIKKMVNECQETQRKLDDFFIKYQRNN